MYAQLDKIPSAGDTIEFEALTLTVLATRGRRITKIRVVRTQVSASQALGQGKTDLILLPAPGEHIEQVDQEKELPAEEAPRYQYRGA